MGEYHLNSRVIKTDIFPHTSLAKEIEIVRKNNQRLITSMNNVTPSKEEIFCYMERITGRKLDATVVIIPPMYSSFGRHLYLGKNITIQRNVTFHDLGGITIEDGVTIGANTTITTLQQKLTYLSAKPVHIKENACIEANATILPGVTIGKNAIVAANSTVDKDVPENTMVAGNPATVVDLEKREWLAANQTNQERIE